MLIILKEHFSVQPSTCSPTKLVKTSAKGEKDLISLSSNKFSLMFEFWGKKIGACRGVEQSTLVSYKRNFKF